MKETTILQRDGALASQNAIKEMEHSTTLDYENDNIDGAARLSNAFLIRNIGIVVAGLALGIALSAGALTSGTAALPPIVDGRPQSSGPGLNRRQRP